MGAYEFLLSEPTIRVVAEDFVQPGQRITARAIPSGVVYSEMFAPYPASSTGEVVWTPDLIASRLSFLSDLWNDNSQAPGVIGLAMTQNVDANGNLQDYAIVTLVSSSGKSTAQLTLDARHFQHDLFGPTVAAARQQLDQTEASGATVSPTDLPAPPQVSGP